MKRTIQRAVAGWGEVVIGTAKTRRTALQGLRSVATEVGTTRAKPGAETSARLFSYS